MRLSTILNRAEKYQSFVHGSGRFEKQAGGLSLVVPARPRRNSRPECSGCGRRGAVDDRPPERRFEYVPLWGLAVFFAYRMRRVSCPRCGVTVERAPWCAGKPQLTTTDRWFLASGARRLSWTEVATIFRTSWDSVCRSVEQAVERGLAHRDRSGVRALGIDEIAWKKGQTHLTLVDDVSGATQRLLAVAEQRIEAGLEECWSSLGQTVLSQAQFVCSDMWRAGLNVIGQRLPEAVPVRDRFHIMQPFGKALDDVRAEEHKRLKRDGDEPVLTKARWRLLKRPENLTERQTVKLAELLKYNLRSVRACRLREDFQRFWTYRSAGWAGRFLDERTGRVMRSRREPMKKVARTLRSHRELLLNWFRAKGEISAGGVEGLNNNAKLVTRKSYGFRTPQIAKLA